MDTFSSPPPSPLLLIFIPQPVLAETAEDAMAPGPPPKEADDLRLLSAMVAATTASLAPVTALTVETNEASAAGGCAVDMVINPSGKTSQGSVMQRR